MANDLKYIDELVRKKMASHAVESSVNNYASIQRAAFWRNFLKFRISSFNAYYTGAIVLIGLFSLGYFYIDDTPDKLAEAKENNALINISKSELEEVKTENNSSNLHQPIAENAEQIANKLSEPLIQSNEETDLQLNSNEISGNITNNEFLKSDPVTTSDISFESVNEKENQLIDEISNLNNEETQSAPEIPSQAQLINSEIEISAVPVNTPSSGIGMAFNDNKEIMNFTYIDPLFFAANPFEDKAPSLDLNRDSVDYYLPPAIRTRWMIGIDYAQIYSYPDNYLIDADYSEMLTEKNKINKPGITFSTGLSVFYQGRKKIGFQTGLSYTQLGDILSRNEIIDIRDASYPLHPDGGYFNVDSAYIANIDSLLQGIDYGVYVYDSTWIIDNTIVEDYDTSRYAGVQALNRYTYIEVPLMLTYKIRSTRLDYHLKFGVAAGFFIKADGKKLSSDDPREIVDFNSNSPKYRTINYSIIGGADILYRFHKRFSFSTGVLYRRNLLNVYKNHPYGIKYSATQFKIGLYYHL